MSDSERPAAPVEGGKKRKRTGKMREAAKRAAIQAQLEGEGLATREANDNADEQEVSAIIPEETVTKDGEDKTAVAVPERDFVAMGKRIPQALKKLHPVFKQAKKMETMRLIKKIKFLRTKTGSSDEVPDLEAQLKLISLVQLHNLEVSHLRQKLSKYHLFKHSQLPEAIATQLVVEPSIPASSSSATPAVISKVENRLCSSKPVADALKPVIAWVTLEPGATLDLKRKGAAPVKKTRQPVSDSDSDDDDDVGRFGDVEDDDDLDGADEDGVPIGIVTALESGDEAVIEDRAADDAGWESGDLGGEGDGDAAGWESGSVDGGDYNIAPPSSGEDEDEGPVSKKSRTATLLEPLRQAEKAPKQKPGKADGSSSVFLPSLAAGFTVGDGDSDPDMDYDEDGVIGSKKAQPRKNRRGQRARQAIWEKKYGKGAKHVVKAREEEKKKREEREERQRKRAERTGSNMEQLGASARGWGNPGLSQTQPRPAFNAAPPHNGSPRPAAAPAPAAAANAQSEQKSLHPSWEAARLRKKREVAGKDMPKATKIVFD